MAINFFNRKKSVMQFILLSYVWNGRHTTHTHNIVMSQLVVLLFVKREVHRCDFLQFLVQFYSQVFLTGSYNFIFSS